MRLTLPSWPVRSLRYNNLGPDGAGAIAYALKVNKTVTTIRCVGVALPLHFMGGHC